MDLVGEIRGLRNELDATKTQLNESRDHSRDDRNRDLMSDVPDTRRTQMEDQRDHGDTAWQSNIFPYSWSTSRTKW